MRGVSGGGLEGSRRMKRGGEVKEQRGERGMKGRMKERNHKEVISDYTTVSSYTHNISFLHTLSSSRISSSLMTTTDNAKYILFI